mgnify:CR=1 FL=1
MMKKLIFISIALITFTGIINAQKSTIAGSWLITKVEVGERTQNPYQNAEFNEDGRFVMMGIEVGTWEYNKSNNAIVMKSDFDKDFNGEGKILSLTENKLVVLKDDAKVYYEKIEKHKIIEENAASGLIGTWKLTNNDSENVKILDFKAPDEFVLVEKDFGSQSTSKGTWIFNKNENSVLLIAFSLEHLKGLNKIINSSSDEISLENKGTIYSFKKEENKATKIEHLTFSEDEFYTENGDYKYEGDEQKLPSWNWSELKNNILNIKQLVYNYSTLIEDTESFENKILTANVHASIEDEGFEIDNIFNGYDSTESDLPINRNFSSPLYPLEETIFRVAGNEQIKTPAGTFDCMKIEVVNYSGVLKKLWMISDKIGIYAKIIEEDTDETFGHYYVYELQEIK